MRHDVTARQATVGEATVTSMGIEPLEGQTTSGRSATGLATIYEVIGPDKLHLRCADISWDSDDSAGEREIHTLERRASPQRFDRLCHGLRLTVQSQDRSASFVELRQARMKSADWSNLFRADLPELDAGARTSVASTLRAHGAENIGYRRDVLSDHGPRRNHACATFAPDARLVPIVAYVLTRVLPILHEVSA